MKENIYGPGDDDYGRKPLMQSLSEAEPELARQIENMGKPIKESSDKPKHIKPGLYAMFYSYLKDIAKEYGYNLLINGSMNRDLDLVAVPWNDHCCFTKEQLMIRDFQEYLTGIKVTDQKGNFYYTVLPGNRHSYIIDLNRGDRNGEWVRFEDCQYYIDISVVQPSRLEKPSV